MARGHGRILTSIWEDGDFLDLEPVEQRLYLFLISQPNLNHAGLLDLTLRRWARKARGLTSADLEKLLQTLDFRRFIVMDEDTEELLIRSFIRNDGVWRMPKVMGAAVSGALEISSKRLQQAVLAEMDRIPLDELSDEPTKTRTGPGPSNRQQVRDHIQTLRNAFAGPPASPSEGGSGTPSAPPSGTPSDTPTEGGPRASTRGRAPASPAHSPAPAPTPAPNPSPLEDMWGAEEPDLLPSDGDGLSEAAEPLGATITELRTDVEQACSLLADLIEENGSRRPAVTREWRDAARLLIDKDAVPFEDVLGAIRWSQANDFWRANVLSMPKLRKQYDTLRLQAKRGRVQAGPATTPRHMTNEEIEDASHFA
ncbi:hypothetical protein ABZY44_21865 [Streptomyces sp. NPDC006544]|uniref:hypothetical protein n=1 Tax=Streptomyces sp. NPDC006544 TaxID=3154583 RepID=UPI0033B3B46B